MRILLATATFPPFKDGVAEAAAAQAHAFAAEGHTVHVATSPHGDRKLERARDHITTREFSILGSPHFRDPYHGDTEAYLQCLRSEPWDAVIFHSYLWPLLLAAPHLRQIPGKKILTSHGYGALLWTPARRFPFGLGSWLWSCARSVEMLRWYKHLDRVVFLSPKIDGRAFYDHFLARACHHKGIRIIPNGVDIPALHSDQRAQSFLDRYGIPRTKHLFLSVANYSWRKDQGFAVRAFRKAAIPNSTLIFIGSEFNECSAAFQRADNEARLPKSAGRVFWLEKVSREHTLSAIQECDTFVLSANHEAQPIALLEAMSYGKPWIARSAGCIDCMEGGVCVRSASSMARAMRLLANDAVLHDTLGKTGRRAVEQKYSSSRYRQQYRNLLREVARSANEDSEAASRQELY